MAPDRVHVVQFERALADPAGALAATFGFCGLPVPGGSVPPHPDEVPATAPDVPDPATRARLAELYAADTARLGALVPDLDPGLWPSTGTTG